MAQTISELEKERAEVLKAIEMQAKQMSTKSSATSTSDAPEHSLNDWLNAAEEVMPTPPRKKSTNTQQKSQSQPVTKTKPNKASFFGVVIMLSLLLTVLGVIYIAYTSIHNELQKVLANNETAMKEIKAMQSTVAMLSKSVASGGQVEAFTELQKKVGALEIQLNELKAKQLALESHTVVAVPATTKRSNKMMTSIIPQENTLSISEIDTALDKRLKVYTQQINQKLELIMQHLQIQVPVKTLVIQAKKPKVADEVSIAQPKVPQVTEPKVKPLNKPVVELVKKTSTPKPIQVPEQPKKSYTADVKWVMAQPDKSYTLQLASMPDKYSLKKIIASKHYPETKILPQTRNGGKKLYILVAGTYPSKKAADQAARHYQSAYKVSPWVRKIKDLKAKIN